MPSVLRCRSMSSACAQRTNMEIASNRPLILIERTWTRIDLADRGGGATEREPADRQRLARPLEGHDLPGGMPHDAIDAAVC